MTITPTIPDDDRYELPPPPPTDTRGGLADRYQFTPFTLVPEMRNRDEVARILQREYPSSLRDAGIGGTVVIHVFIDAEGQVRNVLVHESSGHPARGALSSVRSTPVGKRSGRYSGMRSRGLRESCETTTQRSTSLEGVGVPVTHEPCGTISHVSG